MDNIAESMADLNYLMSLDEEDLKEIMLLDEEALKETLKSRREEV